MPILLEVLVSTKHAAEEKQGGERGEEPGEVCQDMLMLQDRWDAEPIWPCTIVWLMAGSRHTHLYLERVCFWVILSVRDVIFSTSASARERGGTAGTNNQSMHATLIADPPV